MTQESEENENINFRYNFKVYWDFLKKYWFMVMGILFLILIVEASHITDKFLFKVVIDKGTEFVAKTISSSVYVQILLGLLTAYALIVVIRSVGKWLHIHLINILESRLILDVKTKFFNHILGLSHNFHTTHKTGSLISRLIRGSGATERMTDVIVFNFVPLIFNLIVVTISIIYFDVIAAVILFLTVIVFITYSVIIQNLQKEANAAANDAEDIEKANIADIITNIDSIKYFGKEKKIQGRYKNLSETTRETQVRNWHYYRWIDAGQGLILSIGSLLIILYPLLAVLKGSLSIGTLVFIYTVYGNVIGPMFGFVHGMRNFYRAMIDFDALFQYGKIKNEIQDKPNAKTAKINMGEIEFNNISFNYGKRKMFRNFSLKVPSNKKIALVGHSGCGKTTLVKLLYRLYDVESGAIKIDGTDIRDFKQESLRSEMSIVPQECILFDDTIYNNVAFSKPGATREEVLEAIRFAQLDRIIKEFPKKENTIVGERGVRLSGGEKQRVSIARAILANKKILILDEATSSLDSQTEHEIQKDLERLMQGRTTIIIAHRLSTVMKANEIVVMDKSRIIQKGSHYKLITQPGLYKKLWSIQKGGYFKEEIKNNPLQQFI